MPKALVISGGGSKGAFAVGAIKQLHQQFSTFHFDIVVGTSTGSLIAPLAATEEFDLLEELYTTQTTQNIVLKDNLGNRLNQHSIFDANPLWNLITHYFTDDLYNKIMNGNKQIYINTTCLQTGDITVYTNNQNPAPSDTYIVRTFQSADHFRRAIMASACQPVFMPPIQINKQVPGEAHPEYQYVDGGVREYAGVEMAIDNGATLIFTILLSAETFPPTPGEFQTLFPILEQTLDIFTMDVGKNDIIIPQLYNKGLLYINAVKNKMKSAGIDQATIDGYFNITLPDNPFKNKVPLKLYIIRPKEPLNGGPGGLVFDPDTMKQMLATGQSLTGEFLASLPPSETGEWLV
ncbi:patatin-like phospholipase family protein [Pinibacter aurantiacus]|uniref:Patatin-like phospholipase family protein n=1 Tax=Pinibacter aurantiacus TaxID=2851599 RepID=A0A9E2SAA6_9BACT|nr:patatin-like phospholipase family protein [Pinibacter aurantiacus]MBV4359363.1 patatin-like phospholipase family protein [Pinibacter aurantiacus]